MGQNAVLQVTWTGRTDHAFTLSKTIAQTYWKTLEVQVQAPVWAGGGRDRAVISALAYNLHPHRTQSRFASCRGLLGTLWFEHPLFCHAAVVLQPEQGAFKLARRTIRTTQDTPSELQNGQGLDRVSKPCPNGSISDISGAAKTH